MDSHATFRMPRRAETIPAIRAVVAAVLEADGWSDDSVQLLLLAVSEATTNAVLHADGSDSYDVEMSVARGRARIRVRDRGPGISELDLDMPDPGALRGRGMALIHEVSDRTSVRNLPSGGLEVVIEQVREHDRDGART